MFGVRFPFSVRQTFVKGVKPETRLGIVSYFKSIFSTRLS